MLISEHWAKQLSNCLALAMLVLSVDVAFADDITIGLRANRGIEKGIKQWQPTVDHLNSKIPEHNFILSPYESIKELKAAGARGEFHFLLTSPSSYTEMEFDLGATRILTLMNKRKGLPLNRFGSVIFTRSNRPDIQTVPDLKGKKFMAVSEGGFGGWRVAWGELKTNYGIDPFQDFSSMTFSGGVQEKIVLAVRDGLVDAGCVRTDMLERMAADGQIDLNSFRVLGERKTEGYPFKHSTRLYPEWPFAKFPKASNELSNDVARALMDITPEDTAAVAGKYVGWTVPLSYNSVHELLKTLKVTPYENYGKVTIIEAIKQHWVWAVSLSGALILAFAALFSAFWSMRKRKKLEDSIKYMACHDMLTNLPNRALLMDRLDHALARAKRHHTKVAVLFLDLNNFKPINDNLGHLVGDNILKIIADRLSSCLREVDTVARYGGDEFVIVMSDVKHIDEVTTMANKVDLLLLKPIDIGPEERSLGASIGISLYPFDASTSEALIQIADEAMYVAKKKSQAA